MTKTPDVVFSMLEVALAIQHLFAVYICLGLFVCKSMAVSRAEAQRF